MAYYEEKACVAALGSMTMTIKASHVLSAAGIRAQVIGLSATQTKRGCSYGVAFPCEQAQNAKTLLKNARLPVTQYLQRGPLP